MPSSNRPADAGRRFLHLLVVAALAVAIRAPFLLYGERFFDSDEAVEGLMARHVLQGEPAAFLWGQRYKGVPEVYLAAAVFAAAGPGVVALKGVTLACFALFACVQFVVVERLFSRGIAWLATAFLLICPPAFVLWSLSANAEVVMTLLAGTVMVLGVDLWRRTGSRPAFLLACGAAGFGLWVQQYILYYALALALAVFLWLPQRRAIAGRVLAGRDMPPWLRGVTGLLAAAGTLYVVLGTVAFLSGGFDARLFGLPIGVRHPQKLWNIAAALLLAAAAVHVHAAARRHAAARSLMYGGTAAFAAGYAPALAAQLAGGGAAPPIGRANAADLAAALGPIASEILPIAAGLRGPDTAWLDVPAWMMLPVVLAAAASLHALRARPFTPLFHLLVAIAPAVFLLSGAYVDAQSYRYLMPAAGGASVVLAVGMWQIFRWSRAAGAVALVVALACFGLQQRAWYRHLQPDVQSRAILDCLEKAGVQAARADYWLSYKLTFLSDERIIVAPVNGVDRYPPYSAYVAGHPGAVRIPDKMGASCELSSSAQ